MDIPVDDSPVVRLDHPYVGWLLNPGGRFPITALTGYQSNAQRLKSLVERAGHRPVDETVAVLADLIYRKGIRILELDQEVRLGRPELARYADPRDGHQGYAIARILVGTWPLALARNNPTRSTPTSTRIARQTCFARI